MHSYLRAIGFSEYAERAALDALLDCTIADKEEEIMFEKDNGHSYSEIRKTFGLDFGICVCGEYDENDHFRQSYYYPYFSGNGLTTQEVPTIEKHAEKESFAGVCDDFRVGVTLIFYLQNAAEYRNESREKNYVNRFLGVTLSGLSIKGSILLPINKNEKQKKEKREASQYRNNLLAAAKQGDEDAIESLTMEDIDAYTMVSRRMLHEDVFSIVESYFMPCGVECDQYSILGEIMDYHTEKNCITEEELVMMTVNCNDVLFDLCINKKDLLGEPAVGRRFKGNIWMQGRIRYGR